MLICLLWQLGFICPKRDSSGPRGRVFPLSLHLMVLKAKFNRKLKKKNSNITRTGVGWEIRSNWIEVTMSLAYEQFLHFGEVHHGSDKKLVLARREELLEWRRCTAGAPWVRCSKSSGISKCLKELPAAHHHQLFFHWFFFLLECS